MVVDIFLYGNTEANIIIPVIPKKIEIQSPQKIETFETLGQGDLKIIGLKGNRKLSLESFFPNKFYPFAKDREENALVYVNRIEAWRDSREPLSIAISGLEVFFKCTVENFNTAIQDGSGDIYYTLDIEEYKIPTIKKVTSSTKIITVALKPGQVEPPKTTTVNSSTYGVVTNKKGTNMFSGAGLGYSKVKALTYNTKVKLLRLQGDWWQITSNTKTGYVKKDSVKKV